MLYKVTIGIRRLRPLVSADDCMNYPLMNWETAKRISMDSMAPTLGQPGEMMLLVGALHADEAKHKALAALYLDWVKVISCDVEPVPGGVMVLEEAHVVRTPSATMTRTPTPHELTYDDWCIGLKPVTETREEVLV